MIINNSNSRPTSITALLRRERWVALLLLLAGFILRIRDSWSYRIDSDESQHLHVVWQWISGQVQYRDFFDNHMPLFHILFTPVLRLIGERSDALILARLTMLACYATTIWALWRIGRRTRAPRVAMWGAVFAALDPNFFLRSLEFRTDDLWVTLWVLCILVLVGGRMTAQRAGLAGLLLGATLGVSMKTTLLLISLVGSLAVAATLAYRDGTLPRFKTLSLWLGSGLLGFLIIPLSIALYFAMHGAWKPFIYDTITHNMLPRLGRAHWHTTLRHFCWVFGPLALMWQIWKAGRRRTPAARTRDIVVYTTAGLYMTLLMSFWPLTTGQDFMPFFPFLLLYAAPATLKASRMVKVRLARWVGAKRARRVSGPALVVVWELVMLVVFCPPWQTNTHAETKLLHEVLTLSHEGEFVADRKGETVFRPRSSYYVLEGITKTRFMRGRLTDDIPERLIATRTALVCPADYPTTRTQTFVANNYLRIASRMMVLGKRLTASGTPCPACIPFEVTIPAYYAIITPQGHAPGSIDGMKMPEGIFLAAGHHEFRPEQASDQLTLEWARAFDHGFTPFRYEERKG